MQKDTLELLEQGINQATIIILLNNHDKKETNNIWSSHSPFGVNYMPILFEQSYKFCSYTKTKS